MKILASIKNRRAITLIAFLLISLTKNLPIHTAKMGIKDNAESKTESLHDSSGEESDSLQDKDFATVDFTSFKNQKKVKFSNKAPKWRTAYKGLNLVAICKNSKCDAYNDKICIPQGYAVFNIARVIAKLSCVACKQKKVTSVGSCIFYDCTYKVEGQERGKEEFELKGSHEGDDDFKYFKGGEEENVTYLWLQITTTKNKKETPTF